MDQDCVEDMRDTRRALAAARAALPPEPGGELLSRANVARLWSREQKRAWDEERAALWRFVAADDALHEQYGEGLSLSGVVALRKAEAEHRDARAALPDQPGTKD